MNIIANYFNHLSNTQKTQFEALIGLYTEWNEKINVISRKDIENFYVHHVLHSLAIAKVISFKTDSKILDVGTDGGFPGIPLAIMFPDSSFHLTDSIGKKIKVVQAIAEALQLKNVSAEKTRSEELKNKYDFITGRAVTELPAFTPWIKKNISSKHSNAIPNGILYLKGGDIIQEIKQTSMRYEVYEISNYFKEEFFETKKIVHLY